MSALYDAEETDQEAAERLRVAEWAAEHPNPLTAALRRAEAAEEALAEWNRLEVDVSEDSAAPATCVVKRDGHVLFDGVSRAALLREVELHGQFVYEYEYLMDSMTFKPLGRAVARRRLVMPTDGERS